MFTAPEYPKFLANTALLPKAPNISATCLCSGVHATSGIIVASLFICDKICCASASYKFLFCSTVTVLVAVGLILSLSSLVDKS